MYITVEDDTYVADPRCTCHTIREGAGGVTFSDYMLGVLCPHCESAVAEAQAQAWWDELSHAERAVITWRTVGDRLPARRPGAPVHDDPWFPF